MWLTRIHSHRWRGCNTSSVFFIMIKKITHKKLHYKYQQKLYSFLIGTIDWQSCVQLVDIRTNSTVFQDGKHWFFFFGERQASWCVSVASCPYARNYQLHSQQVHIRILQNFASLASNISKPWSWCLLHFAYPTKCHLQDLKLTSLCANCLIFFTDDNLLHQESQAEHIDLDLFVNNISNTNIAHQQNTGSLQCSQCTTQKFWVD